MAAVLQIEKLESGYGEVQVLWGISLEVQAGKMTTVIGANGAGKTTTLRTIMGSVPSWGGRVLMNGEDVTRMSPHAKANRGLVLVPEGRQLFPDMSVEENLEMGAYSRRARKGQKQNLERVYDAFPRLKERRKQLSSTLSGGEQQMLAIGRALMTNPQLLILDEATEGLAPVNRQAIWKVLGVLKAAGQSILLIDKNLKNIINFADRHYVIERGRVMWSGTSADLKAHYAEIRKLVGV